MTDLRTRLPLLTGLCALFLLALPLAADGLKEDKGGFDQAAMEEAMMNAMTPGDNHKFLAGLVGNWSAKMKMWMEPGAEPQENSGTVKRRMIMGGRYLLEEFEGTYNGMPFQGLGHTGYDNVTKQFVGSWMDNFGTGILINHGQRDGDTLTMQGEMASPMGGGNMKLRMVTRMVDKDNQIFEYYVVMAPGMPEMKQMVINYTRVAE